MIEQEVLGTAVLLSEPVATFAASDLVEDVVLSTRSPAHLLVVAGRSAVGNLDVVAGSLVPSNHLLGTGEALG